MFDSGTLAALAAVTLVAGAVVAAVPVAAQDEPTKAERLADELGLDELDNNQREEVLENAIEALKDRRKELKEKDARDAGWGIDYDDWGWHGASDKVDEINKILNVLQAMKKSTHASGTADERGICQELNRRGTTVDVSNEFVQRFGGWSFVLNYIPLAHISDLSTLVSLYQLGEVTKDELYSELPDGKAKRVIQRAERSNNAWNGHNGGSGMPGAWPDRSNLRLLSADTAERARLPAEPGPETCGLEPATFAMASTVPDAIRSRGLPSGAGGVVAGERVNVYVGENLVGYRFSEDAELEAVDVGGYPDGTVTVEMSEATAREIASAEEPVGAAKRAYVEGEIQTESEGLVNEAVTDWGGGAYRTGHRVYSGATDVVGGVARGVGSAIGY